MSTIQFQVESKPLHLIFQVRTKNPEPHNHHHILNIRLSLISDHFHHQLQSQYIFDNAHKLLDIANIDYSKHSNLEDIYKIHLQEQDQNWLFCYMLCMFYYHCILDIQKQTTNIQDISKLSYPRISCSNNYIFLLIQFH